MFLIFIILINFINQISASELIKTEISNLKYYNVQDSLNQIDLILNQISSEFKIKKFHGRFISWKEYPGEEEIYNNLKSLIVNFGDIDSEKSITFQQEKKQIIEKLPKITESIHTLNDQIYMLDPGWIKNGYYYCRYYYIHTNEPNVNNTGLIFISFITEDKIVFERITVLVSDMVVNIGKQTFKTLEYIPYLLFTLIVLIFIKIFIF